MRNTVFDGELWTSRWGELWKIFRPACQACWCSICETDIFWTHRRYRLSEIGVVREILQFQDVRTTSKPHKERARKPRQPLDNSPSWQWSIQIFVVNDLFENSRVNFQPLEGDYKDTRRYIIFVKVSCENWKVRIKTPSQERGSIKIPVATHQCENWWREASEVHPRIARRDGRKPENLRRWGMRGKS